MARMTCLIAIARAGWLTMDMRTWGKAWRHLSIEKPYLLSRRRNNVAQIYLHCRNSSVAVKNFSLCRCRILAASVAVTEDGGIYSSSYRWRETERRSQEIPSEIMIVPDVDVWKIDVWSTEVPVVYHTINHWGCESSWDSTWADNQHTCGDRSEILLCRCHIKSPSSKAGWKIQRSEIYGSFWDQPRAVCYRGLSNEWREFVLLKVIR